MRLSALFVQRVQKIDAAFSRYGQILRWDSHFARYLLRMTEEELDEFLADDLPKLAAPVVFTEGPPTALRGSLSPENLRKIMDLVQREREGPEAGD